MARTLMDDARDELERARSPHTRGDEYVLAQRQAAEKAWGFLVEHVDASLGIAHVGTAEAHRLRRELLAELQRSTGRPVLEVYREIADELHGNCFYLGRCHLPSVERLVQSAADFPRLLEEAQRDARRSRGRP